MERRSADRPERLFLTRVSFGTCDRSLYSDGMRFGFTLAVVGFVSAAILDAEPQRGAKPTRRTTTAVTCSSDLGRGAKSARQFCDVLISKAGAESVVMAIPPHSGTATLKFDLHNRFVVPLGRSDPGATFTRNSAIVAVLRSTGEQISRAAVAGEFRTVQDLFDRISGAGPGGVKAVAPGPAEPYEVTIPTTVSSISLVGVRVEVLRRTGQATLENEGTPVAIVSNLRIEYTPR